MPQRRQGAALPKIKLATPGKAEPRSVSTISESKGGFDHESGTDFNHHPDCAAVGQRSDVALQPRLGLSSERHPGDDSSHRSDTGSLETNLKSRIQNPEFRSQNEEAENHSSSDFLF